MILKTCPELLDRTGQTVQTSGMEEKCSLWDMHTAVHTLLLHKDYWAGKQARRSLGAAKRKLCTSPGEMPLSPRRVPKSRTELRVALRQWAGALPGAAQTADIVHGWGQAHLTAAKRTLMLDSDRPLTIRSIMFSVSMIWAKELRSVHNSTASMACWGFGYSTLNVTYKICS